MRVDGDEIDRTETDAGEGAVRLDQGAESLTPGDPLAGLTCTRYPRERESEQTEPLVWDKCRSEQR